MVQCRGRVVGIESTSSSTISRRRSRDFEDGIAVTNLLPGPASTQLAIFCAWRLRGRLGAVVAGICFIVPGLIIILALAALFLASDPPRLILGVAAGLSAAVPAVAVNAAVGLIPPSWKRAGSVRARQTRWVVYFLVGAVGAATAGALLVLLLVGCGLVEVSTQRRSRAGFNLFAVAPGVAAPTVGGLTALAWVALKVGALSYGGGFVIIPLMQHDATDVYH